MKHLDLKYYWLRDEVEKGTLAIDYVSTDFIVADIFVRITREDTLETMELDEFYSEVQGFIYLRKVAVPYDRS